MKTLFRPLSIATLFALACAPPVNVQTGEPQPATADRTESPDQPWAIKTREHTDLWLHGFAMLQEDTTLVPLFRRGYREQMIVARNAANRLTLLDANYEQLRARFSQNRLLPHAQFAALHFDSANDLRLAIEYFLRAEGRPQAASSREIASVIAMFASYFPSPADREWLRLFWQSLSDESAKFYHDYWVREQQARAATLTAVDSLWQGVYRPRLRQFLANSQQANGSLYLSLPLDGEGRTLNLARDQSVVAVAFPDSPGNGTEAVYVAVHEMVIGIANTGVNDNLTPAEQRAGLGETYASAAAVRAGAMLLQQLAPEVVDGYSRYYLRAANRPIGANVQTSLANTFPLTDAIRDAITRQLEIVLGGI